MSCALLPEPGPRSRRVLSLQKLGLILIISLGCIHILRLLSGKLHGEPIHVVFNV